MKFAFKGGSLAYLLYGTWDIVLEAPYIGHLGAAEVGVSEVADHVLVPEQPGVCSSACVPDEAWVRLDYVVGEESCCQAEAASVAVFYVADVLEGAAYAFGLA